LEMELKPRRKPSEAGWACCGAEAREVIIVMRVVLRTL
jgi:hypothetical protein